MQTLYRSELQPHGRRSDATAAITAGVTCRYGAHAMDVSIGKHVHPQVVLRRTRRVERRFRRYWRPAAYPPAHPDVTEKPPLGLSLGRLPSRALAGYVATVPMLRTASGCEDGSIYPSLFAAVRNVMASW